MLIKPNVTGAVTNPTTTSPEVLYAVIKLVAERGPKRIIVADRSFSPIFYTKTPKTVDVMKKVGQIDAVEQAKSDAKAPVVAVGLEDCEDELERLGRKGHRHVAQGQAREGRALAQRLRDWPSCCSPSTT